MGYRDNRERVQQVLEHAKQQGCTVELRNSGHYKITTPSGGAVFCAATPSDHRGVRRTISILRKNGVDL